MGSTEGSAQHLVCSAFTSFSQASKSKYIGEL